jgi:hypothetical protein
MLQLRNGDQIMLEEWMTLQHVPEYGIVGKSLPLIHNDEIPNNKANTATNNARNSKTHIAAATQEQVIASHMKTKKDAAIDSTFPPTAEEIYCHIRYLSEEGIKLVMTDIDECARETLRYSSSIKVKEGEKNKKCKNNYIDGGNWSNNIHLKTLAEEIYDYIEKFQPQYNNNNDDDDNGDIGNTSSINKERSKDDPSSLSERAEEEEEERREIMAEMIQCRNRRYNPTLLPLIVIKCYPSSLDRSEMSKVLSLDLSKRNNPSTAANLFSGNTKRPSSSTPSSSTSSCIVTIKSTSNLVQQGHLLAEILSQCISNDPNGEEYAIELTRQRKRLRSQVSRIDVDDQTSGGGGKRHASIFSVWSWTSSLVDWCSTVECFDSIIVLLEDIENIPSPTLDTFFTTLISLRSWHGIPISIPGGLGDRLSTLRNPSNHDSGGGEGGVAKCELELPLRRTQFDIFAKQLFFSGKCFPSFLWTNKSLWNHAQEIFHEFDNSIMSLGRHLKAELRRYFAVPGAFLTLLHCKEFVIPNESRLTWLFGDENSRKFLSIQHASSSGETQAHNEEKGKKDGHIVDLFQKIEISYISHQLLQKIYIIFELTPFRETQFLSTLTRDEVKNRATKLIRCLYNARQKLAAGKTSKDFMSIQTKLDEYIILLAECAFQEVEPKLQVTKALLEDIIRWVEERFPLQIVLSEPIPPATQPRRDVARALVKPLPEAISKHFLSLATRNAFQVFQSRVMSLSELYNK